MSRRTGLLHKRSNCPASVQKRAVLVCSLASAVIGSNLFGRQRRSKQLASYSGLVPEEKSSGDWRRLGHISNKGNVMLRFWLVCASKVYSGLGPKLFMESLRLKTTRRVTTAVA